MSILQAVGEIGLIDQISPIREDYLRAIRAVMQ